MKRLQEEDVRSAMQNAQTEALRYKRLATKYIAAWRDAIKRNDNKVDIVQFIVKNLENYWLPKHCVCFWTNLFAFCYRI